MILSLNSKVYAQVTLAPDEFDFYADTYTRFKYLQKDTAISADEIKALNVIIREQSLQAEMDSLIVINKDKVVAAYKDSFDKLSEKYEKQAKKKKRLKSFAIASASVNVVLILIVAIALL